MIDLMNPEFIDWIFKGTIIYFIRSGLSNFKGMKDSIEELNTKIAVLLEKDLSKDKQIEIHEKRIARIEQNIIENK